jgi:hypothetical protein
MFSSDSSDSISQKFKVKKCRMILRLIFERGLTLGLILGQFMNVN